MGDVANKNANLAIAHNGEAVDVSAVDVSFITGAITRVLYIGTAGDVKVDVENGGTGIVFANVPIGFLPIWVKKVYSVGTTATDIVSIW